MDVVVVVNEDVDVVDVKIIIFIMVEIDMRTTKFLITFLTRKYQNFSQMWHERSLGA